MTGLEARLAELAAQGKTISYGSLARELALPGPGAIAQLTLALERLMAEDAKAGRPFRAAVVCARLGQGLPAQGFFDQAAALGRGAGDDRTGYITAERRALQLWARQGG